MGPDSSDPTGRPHPVPVVIADALAGELLRAAVTGLRVQADRAGVRLDASPHLLALLHELHAAEERHTRGDEPSPAFAGETSTVDGATLDDKVIATSDAAARLGCSPQWVRRLLRAGRLRGQRHGPSWLITERDLDDYRHGRRTA